MKGPSGSPSPSPPSSPLTGRSLLSFSAYNQIISPSGVSVARSGNVDWKALEKKVNEVTGFLHSLEKNKIGGGLMLYNDEKFCLEPCSNWFNSYTLQWIATFEISKFRRDKRATFEAVRAGFLALLVKIRSIESAILSFKVDHDNCTEGERLQESLTHTERIIKSVASFGLSKLANNYSDNQFFQHSADLSGLGNEAFKLIETMTTALTEKLLPFVPDLEDNTTIAKYFYNARPLLVRRNVYRENMQAVKCDKDHGLSIPVGLVRNCLSDSEGPKVKREALQNAAAYIGLPGKAKEIRTQDGVTAWQPIRLLGNEKGGSIFQEGVFGTCERKISDNLCNLYYRVDPDTKNVVISSGSINSPLKAEQLAIVMSETLRLTANASDRWCVLSLNSYFKEQKLINGVHANTCLNDAFFRKALGRKNTALLHMNACFNSATMFPKEDSKSVKRVNCDSLALLASFIKTDLNEMLSGRAILNALQVDDDNDSYMDTCSRAQLIAGKIKEIKKKIIVLKEGVRTDYSSSVQNRDLLSEDETLEVYDDDAPEGQSPILPKFEIEEQKIAKTEASDTDALLSDFFVMEEDALPDDIKALEKLLSEKRIQLQKELQCLNQSLVKSITLLKAESEKDNAFEIKSSLLILEVYQRILSVQLQLPDQKLLSRCGEIELILLLYRLLNINAIIICWSGLDRSGSVRALADSQSQLERTLVKHCLDERKKKVEFQTRDLEMVAKMLSPQDEATDRLTARRKIFDLINDFDANRDELFSMANEIIQEHSDSNFVTDLKLFDETQPSSFNIRAELFEKIDEKYPDQTDKKGEDLMLTQHYMELYGKHLLGTEGVKPLYSNGVPGLKYLYNAGAAQRFFGNFHFFQRLPQFIFAEDKTILLLEYSKGWRDPNYTTGSNLPLKLTQAGIDLTHRLSQLRGT